MGLAMVAAALAAWLVMRKRRIRNSGSSDEESPHMKGGGYGVGKRFPNGAQPNDCQGQPVLARAVIHACSREQDPDLVVMLGGCSVPVVCAMVIYLAIASAGRSLDGGNNGVIKDSASSTVSGEIGMQPYIRRSGTDDSGCVSAVRLQS